MFNTYEGQVYIQNGNNKVAHTVRVQADSTYSAQQQLMGMYGAANIIGNPQEVNNNQASGASSYNPSPWM